jgi:hypothetical protein
MRPNQKKNDLSPEEMNVLVSLLSSRNISKREMIIWRQQVVDLFKPQLAAFTDVLLETHQLFSSGARLRTTSGKLSGEGISSDERNKLETHLQSDLNTRLPVLQERLIATFSQLKEVLSGLPFVQNAVYQPNPDIDLLSLPAEAAPDKFFELSALEKILGKTPVMSF